MGHFKTDSLRSICSGLLVRLVRGKDHFLFRLSKTILVEAYEGKACRGKSSYHPLILFKMLFPEVPLCPRALDFESGQCLIAPATAT
jgi:hypothetical protein